jgi:hypothetical protein
LLCLRRQHVVAALRHLPVASPNRIPVACQVLILSLCACAGETAVSRQCFQEGAYSRRFISTEKKKVSYGIGCNITSYLWQTGLVSARSPN